MMVELGAIFQSGLGCAQSANALSYYLDAINRLDATQATDIKYIPANVLQVNRANLHIMMKILSEVLYVWVGFQPCIRKIAESYFCRILNESFQYLLHRRSRTPTEIKVSRKN